MSRLPVETMYQYETQNIYQLWFWPEDATDPQLIAQSLVHPVIMDLAVNYVNGAFEGYPPPTKWERVPGDTSVPPGGDQSWLAMWSLTDACAVFVKHDLIITQAR